MRPSYSLGENVGAARQRGMFNKRARDGFASESREICPLLFGKLRTSGNVC